MTDTEIIKALEKCTGLQTSTSCLGCKYTVGETGSAFDRYCKDALLVDALNLINRQKAEIERLQNDLAHIGQHSLILIDSAKAEAIKDFAEKLNAGIAVIVTHIRNGHAKHILELIDNLVKEMVGESDEKL